MNVLIIGGTGLISTGIIKHLLRRGASVTMFNRGQRENRLDGPVQVVSGDRNDRAAMEQCVAGGKTWDVVIDMICFDPKQAEAAIEIFAHKCRQFIFCSTVCTYGVKVPPGVIVDESFPQEPISTYGKNKVACEKLFNAAHERGEFAVTIVRPSCSTSSARGSVSTKPHTGHSGSVIWVKHPGHTWTSARTPGEDGHAELESGESAIVSP